MGEELDTLEEQVRAYETAVGRQLVVPGNLPQVPALPGNQPEGPQPAPPAHRFRIHAADVQLTFNKSAWRLQELDTDEWFRKCGVGLVKRFQVWGVEEVQQNFQEKIIHISLTLEESSHAADGARRAPPSEERWPACVPSFGIRDPVLAEVFISTHSSLSTKAWIALVQRLSLSTGSFRMSSPGGCEQGRCFIVFSF